MQKLTKLDYQIRLSVLLLAFISPLIYLMISGYQPSLSSYWNTICQPMFIVVNTSTLVKITWIVSTYLGINAMINKDFTTIAVYVVFGVIGDYLSFKIKIKQNESNIKI